jgi:hypothetical protein
MTAQLFPFPSGSLAREEFRWTGANISDQDLTALNVGAHLCSSFNAMPCDSLDIPADREAFGAVYLKSWGISNAVETRMTVGHLLDGMHSQAYELVLPLVQKAVAGADGHTVEHHRQFLALRAAGRGESAGGAIAAYDSLHSLHTVAKPFAGWTRPTWPTHIRAWDFARLPYVVRGARHLGYIDDAESWMMLHANLDAARAYYPNWRQFGHGIIIGRMFWCALTDVNSAKSMGDKAASAVTALLARPDSPWRRTPLSR